MTEAQRCETITKSGQQCRGRALPGETYCAVHSPQANVGRSLGRQHRSTIVRAAKRLPPDMRQLVDMLAEGVEDVRDGKLKPAQLSAMAAGASAAVKVLELALLTAELEVLRGQVAELALQRAQEVSHHGR
jgi:hypothetical protein